MSEIKAVIFDADGVVVRNKAPFSHGYAAERGFDPSEVAPFFSGDFQEALVGRADLKDLLEKHRELWRLQSSPEDLMSQWFAAEHSVDEVLVSEIKKLRKLGIRCVLATNQEKYRAEYIEKEMVAGVFDRVYSSAALGVKKPEPEFYAKILEDLGSVAEPNEAVCFDDDVENVKAAQKTGIRAVLYKDITDFHTVFDREDSL